MGRENVIIIGAGIAGLAAGCYLQMNGYSTQIFEMHSIPGGLCTGWQRQGYTFDGCIHWLVGSSPMSQLHTIWQELGAIQDRQMVNHELFTYTELPTGETFSAYNDLDALQKEMLRIAPEDETLIKDFIQSAKICTKFEAPVLKAPELFNIFDGLKFMIKGSSFLNVFKKWTPLSVSDFARQFTNPTMKSYFPIFFGMPEQMAMPALIMSLSWFHNKTAGYPIGGSLPFIKSIECKYRSLGGKVHYNSKVAKILVEENKSVGILLERGEAVYSDLVISAADGYSTIYKLLKGRFLDNQIIGYYEKLTPFSSLIQVSLGIGRTFKDIPDALTHYLFLEDPIYLGGGNTAKVMPVKFYSHDPTMAPDGKTAVVVLFQSDYSYWTKLKKENREAYIDEKERIVGEVIARLEKRFGDIAANVETYDVATPATYIRYTNNWKGSFEGWLPTPEAFSLRMHKTLPGLKNFYMVGQWVQPGGGLPTGGIGGRHLAQLICKEDRKKFKVI